MHRFGLFGLGRCIGLMPIHQFRLSSIVDKSIEGGSKSDSHCIAVISQGGVDIGDVDAKALKMEVAVGGSVDESSVKKQLLNTFDAGKRDRVAKFVTALYRLYVDLYFTYLEINPLVVTDDKIYILDLAAKVTINSISCSRNVICSGLSSRR